MALDTTCPIIQRSGPNAVTYDLSQPHLTFITLPMGSEWSSGLHWHETHDEYLRVLRGTIRVRLGEGTRLLRPGEEARVPKYVRHEWSRADILGGEEVIVAERTDPADIQKHLFFWNLNGVILNAQAAKADGWLAELLTTFKLFLIFYTLDNWPVFYDLSSYWGPFGITNQIEAVVTHALLAAAALIARLMGYKAVDAKFTPQSLLHVYEGCKKGD